MDHWNYSRASQQQGHPQAGQLGYPPGGSVGAPYGSQLFSQSSFGQAYGQQILGTGGKTGSDEYQGGAVGSAGLSGVYGLDSKFSSSGYGVAGASPAAFNQKADQLSALGQYAKSQSSFLGADGHSDALKRYSESQLLQTALRQGTAPSVLDGGVRSQSDYLSAGRNSAIASAGGGAYGAGRDLLGSTYGVTRSEAEAALLGSQVGLAARSAVGVLPFQAADSLGSLAGGRGILGAMYPPGVAYSSLDLAAARSSISGMSDLAGIGSARYDDRLDDRLALRYDYERRDDDRRVRERSRERDRDRERERERERSWERERERERERVRERDWARERERLRDRERTRERERDRERELRRRERTPPKILPAPRRDEKVGKKFSPPPPRFSSPLKPRKREYVCKVEPFSLAERERDLLSLIRRYPRLYVSADFSKVVVCWKEQAPDIALNQPISFEHDAVDAEEEKDGKDAAMISTEDAESLTENIVWTVKVMLMSGASDDCMKELLSDTPSEDKPAHLHSFLRFVVLRKERSALMGAGGAWSKMLDGGDPAVDESALIRTAIRCTKDATQLDLGGVSSWKRIMEVHYDRVRDNGSAFKEIIVFFIPDLSGCLPTLENWKLQWKQRREARLKREASQKQEKDGKSGGSLKDAQKKDKTEKKEDKDTKEEKKDPHKEEKVERDAKNDKKEKETKEDKKDAKKEEKKDKDSKKEEKKEKDIKKDDKKDKDVKKEEKKEKDVKQEDRKEKDVKKDDKKQELKKDRKGKTERKDKEERKDVEKKEEKKDDKDVKATKGKGSDKKGKAVAEEEAPDLPGFFITSKRNKFDKKNIMQPKISLLQCERIATLGALLEVEARISKDLPGVVFTIDGNSRAMTISLDGLLDYDERDKEESTFELSLFAEVFQEMLQFRFGSQLLEAFESLHLTSQARKKEERKRFRHEKDTKATTNKKSKFSDSAVPSSNTDEVQKVDENMKDSSKVDESEKKDDTKPVKDIDAAMQEASLINFDELEDELQETPEVLDADVADEEGPLEEASKTKKSDRNVVIDEELLKAFRYFDRNRSGFVKAEDVRRLVHILGRFLTRRWVKDLTTTALSESKSKDDCIYYQKLVEKEAV